MFWTEFKRYCFFILCFLFLACSSKTDKTRTKSGTNVKSVQTELNMSENYIVRQVVNKLKIDATEKYDINILYEYINPDTLKDALILVNRKEFAFKHVKENNTENFFQKMGYTAAYNYIFVKLGNSKELLSTTPVGSNVNFPLENTFLELTSKAYRDFYVEYRVRNSLHRNYYTVRNNNIYLTFSCLVYDSIGEKKPVVYDIKHIDSPVRTSKDIALYYSRFKDYDPADIEDINNYKHSEIIDSDDLYVYFIFDEKTMQYKTPMSPQERE